MNETESIGKATHWQFSLRTLLLLMAVVGAGMALYVVMKQSRENAQLRSENRKLRTEVGSLLIEPGEENRLHAVGVPTTEDNLWKWRVYVPKGKTWTLYRRAGLVPAEGAVGSRDGGQMGLLPGEQTVSLTLRRDIDGNLNWHLALGNGSVTGGAGTLPTRNFEQTAQSLTEQMSIQNGEQLQLLRLRRFPSALNTPTTSTANEGEGVLLWIGQSPDFK